MTADLRDRRRSQTAATVGAPRVFVRSLRWYRTTIRAAYSHVVGTKKSGGRCDDNHPPGVAASHVGNNLPGCRLSSSRTDGNTDGASDRSERWSHCRGKGGGHER